MIGGIAVGAGFLLLVTAVILILVTRKLKSNSVDLQIPMTVTQQQPLGGEGKIRINPAYDPASFDADNNIYEATAEDSEEEEVFHAVIFRDDLKYQQSSELGIEGLYEDSMGTVDATASNPADARVTDTGSHLDNVYE